MEEMMLMMINLPSQSIPHESINTSTFPSWKLYENPFYNPHQIHHHHPQHSQINTTLLCLSSSFFDSYLSRSAMDSELEFAKTQILDLKTELQIETKARKKAESMNKKLARELYEERRGREAMERICEQLAKEISLNQAEISRMKKEIEEERKMMKMAEGIREERVQMKLAEAKIFFEEKLSELDFNCKFKELVLDDENFSDGKSKGLILGEKPAGKAATIGLRRGSPEPEPENHHIKRGIKGFVEFPRVVRAIGSKSRNCGTKLECQKAQLRILLKQKSLIRSNNFIIS